MSIERRLLREALRIMQYFSPSFAAAPSEAAAYRPASASRATPHLIPAAKQSGEGKRRDLA
jgi:hypothetical protein